MCVFICVSTVYIRNGPAIMSLCVVVLVVVVVVHCLVPYNLY